MEAQTVQGLYVVGGAVLGACVGAALTWLLTRRDRARRELSVVTGRTTPVMSVESSLSDTIDVFVDGVRVPEVYTLDARIVNTGTETIRDVEIQLDVTGAQVLSADMPDAPGEMLIGASGRGATLEISYINRAEVFLARLLLDAKPTDVTPRFRQPDVAFRAQVAYETSAVETVNRVLFAFARANVLFHLSFLVLPTYRRYLKDLKERE